MDRHAVAVIISNARYKGDVPSVDYALNDGVAMRRFVMDGLGVDPNNIIDVQNAGLADLLDLFGNEREHRGRVWSLVRPGRSKLYVFYSGHGVPGSHDRRGYILPVDAEPSRPEIGGYPLDLLYANLEKIDTASTLVMIDSCFSGQSDGGTLIQSASPVFVKAELPKPKGDLTVLAAAKADQIASWDHDARLGLFTSYLLKGFYGDADREGWGNGDGRVTIAEIGRYLGDEMSYAARRQFGRVQDPDVAGAGDTVIVPQTARPQTVTAGADARARSTQAVAAAPPVATRSATPATQTPEIVAPTDVASARAFLTAHRGPIVTALNRYYEAEGRAWDFIHMSIGQEDFAERIHTLRSLNVVGFEAGMMILALSYDWEGYELRTYPADAKARLAVEGASVRIDYMWK